MVKCTEERAASATRRLGEGAQPGDDPIIPAGAVVNGGGGGELPVGPGAGSVYGFRLCGGETGSAGDRAERESATSASVYSFYKQRIDAMFDETRSQISGAGGRRTSEHALYHRLESEEEQRQRKINNSVQARIERMFAEMAGVGDGRGGVVAKAITGTRFSVDYLGSVGLRDKVTSLQGLQRPLADLYFAYCRLREDGNDAPPASGTLEISGCGLKVHHGGGPDQTELEQLNPFPTIAVWAAVKFVSRARASDGAPEYAFLPLIADPDAVDKGALFRPLQAADRRAVAAAAATYASPAPGDDPACGHHAPLLAVVMRKLGVSRQLECHGFVCARSEDAVVIAANLYQALMAFMQARHKAKASKSASAAAGPRNRNGISYISVASSSVAGDAHETDSTALKPPPLRALKPRLSNGTEPSVIAKCDFPESKDTLPLPKRQPSIKLPPPVPVRPPRRKTKSSASSASDEAEEPIVIQQGLPPKQGAEARDAGAAAARVRHSRSESEPCAGAATVQLAPLGVRRTASDLQGYPGAPGLPPFGDAPDGCGGDILTKVAIPRSRSFLNAGGPLTRYGRRQSAGPGYGGGGGAGGGNGSPLGFKELFAEFRVQEGLNSMDDILGAIIDAEGMSFNDLKPIYKEFLLKLAVTLTKDELYQRSKSIMRRQRKKNRRKGAGCVNRKKSFTSGGGGIKRVFRRSVNKLKQSKPRPQSFEFTSVLFPSSVPLRASKKIRGGGFSVESTTTSTSSYSARNFQLRGGSSGGGGGGSGARTSGVSRALRLPRRLSSASSAKRRAALARRRAPPPPSASEDSDFFSLARASGGGGSANGRGVSASAATLAPQNRSSSGYFSCSECSYDSESCTCTSADKCYCSLGEGKSRAQAERAAGKEPPSASPPRAAATASGRDRTLSSCGCDTDSCLESDKCYCSPRDPGAHHHHRRVGKPPGAAVACASVFDQLKQRGFAVSESSVSRVASPPRRRRAAPVPAQPASVRAAKSLEVLGGIATSRAVALQTRRTRSDESGASGGAFGRRMDVYAQPPAPPRAASRRSHSSDNLVVDYDLFTTSSRSEAEDDGAGRVLVVSARDPRGRIVCMGASCRSDAGRGARAPLPAAATAVADVPGARRRSRRAAAAAAAAASASEALSVKKSAEIAAVFSDIKATAAEEIRADALAVGKDMFFNGVHQTDYYFASRASVKSYLGSSLENSLGYLP